MLANLFECNTRWAIFVDAEAGGGGGGGVECKEMLMQFYVS